MLSGTANDDEKNLFADQWTDAASLHVHSLKPESAAFTKAMRNMSVAEPVMGVFQASELPISDLE